MKETLRSQAPGPRDATVPDSSLATPIIGTQSTQSTQSTTQATHHGITSSNTTTLAPNDTTQHHGTSAHENPQSVIEKLQSNVQASVRETTGRSDPDVAAKQPSTSAGKTFLEGLGLGGDERQSTFNSTPA